MNILQRFKEGISGQVLKPLQDEMSETDWGYMDVNAKVDPASVALVAIAVIVVAMIIFYMKKVI
jgi:hypothetical protein